MSFVPAVREKQQAAIDALEISKNNPTETLAVLEETFGLELADRLDLTIYDDDGTHIDPAPTAGQYSVITTFRELALAGCKYGMLSPENFGAWLREPNDELRIEECNVVSVGSVVSPTEYMLYGGGSWKETITGVSQEALEKVLLAAGTFLRLPVAEVSTAISEIFSIECEPKKS